MLREGVVGLAYDDCLSSAFLPWPSSFVPLLSSFDVHAVSTVAPKTMAVITHSFILCIAFINVLLVCQIAPLRKPFPRLSGTLRVAIARIAPATACGLLSL